MHAHAAVAAPQPEAAPERQPAPRPGDSAPRLTALQLARRLAPARPDELRMGEAALQRAVATRRMVAREDQAPGPPEASEMKGMSCGFNEKGEWKCTAETGKGGLEVDPKSVPSTKPPTLPNRPPASCPTDRWDWFNTKCCPEGHHFDQSQRKCASNNKEAPMPIKPFELPSPSIPLPPSSPAPFTVPPAPEPPPKGDFPLPSGDQMYA
jgi:hypothetical protein